MVNIDFNLWAFASIILFWMTMAGTEAWVWRSWLTTPIWLWMSINLGALLAALLISGSTVYLLFYLFSFPPFNIFLLLVIVAFTAPLSFIQWLVLRPQLIAPRFWSVINVILGLGIWILLQIFVTLPIYHSWQSLVISIVAGVIVGVLSSTLINTWGRR